MSSEDDAILATVHRAAEQIREATRLRDASVVTARDGGATWRAIALAAGITEAGVINIYRRAKEGRPTRGSER